MSPRGEAKRTNSPLSKNAFPTSKSSPTQDEIINDPSTQLILTSQIANERAAIGIRAMKHGKDVLSDKPGVTTLEDLAAIRKTIAETKKIYAIMYSERLEVKAAVKAGELVQAGAIGRVIQTINIAPHQIIQGHGGDAGGSGGRPEWFWNPVQYGGILCDIGSHQVDQFLFYTGSTEAEVAESQIANVNHPSRPNFQDFGDMVLRGNRGFGYVRLDWFTPDGLGTWATAASSSSELRDTSRFANTPTSPWPNRATTSSSSIKSSPAISIAITSIFPLAHCSWPTSSTEPTSPRTRPSACWPQLVIKAQKNAKLSISRLNAFFLSSFAAGRDLLLLLLLLFSNTRCHPAKKESHGKGL